MPSGPWDTGRPLRAATGQTGPPHRGRPQDWLCRKDKVGSVVIDAEIIRTDIRNRAEERDRRFLTGFKRIGNAALTAVFRNPFHCDNEFLIQFIIGILRYKTEMREDRGNTGFLAEIDSLMQPLNPGVPVFTGNKADGKRAFIKIPDIFSRPHADKAGGSYTMFFQPVADFFRRISRNNR